MLRAVAGEFRCQRRTVADASSAVRGHAARHLPRVSLHGCQGQRGGAVVLKNEHGLIRSCARVSAANTGWGAPMTLEVHGLGGP